MTRRKCEIIPVSVYDDMKKILVEDNNNINNNAHKYHKGEKGHYLKIIRKTCSLCASPAVYVGIFRYPRHTRVERFCKEHAAQFTNAKELPPIRDLEITRKTTKSVII